MYTWSIKNTEIIKYTSPDEGMPCMMSQGTRADGPIGALHRLLNRVRALNHAIACGQ